MSPFLLGAVTGFGVTAAVIWTVTFVRPYPSWGYLTRRTVGPVLLFGALLCAVLLLWEWIT